MIQAQGLRREFGSFVAVHDLSLQVPDGTILALLGPNGAGKTTTVRMLTGLLAPTAGEATVDGWDVRTHAAEVRTRVGLVTDTPGLHDQMNPVSYLRFFGGVYGLDGTTCRRRIDELLELFGLQEVRGKRMAGFSRGMQQRVALARALLHEPSAVFLDEPTAGLDPLAARLVRDVLGDLKRTGRSIVLCTHDLAEAERLADNVVILRHGQAVAAGTTATLRANAVQTTVVRVTFAVPCETAATLAARVAGVEHARLESAAIGDVSDLVYATASPAQTNPDVIAALAAVGARMVSVSSGVATLEDVYASAQAGEPVVEEAA
jgi:ABC-2 type transport system ATP-binding protein